MTEPKTATIDEVRALPVVATLTIPMWDRDYGDGETLHSARSRVVVPVVIQPDLGRLGQVLYEHHYDTAETFIVLREWNPQVLLHEVLHVILGPGAEDDPHNHRIVNAVEVGLAPFFEPTPCACNPAGAVKCVVHAGVCQRHDYGALEYPCTCGDRAALDAVEPADQPHPTPEAYTASPGWTKATGLTGGDARVEVVLGPRPRSEGEAGEPADQPHPIPEADKCSTCGGPLDSPPCSLNRELGISGHTGGGGFQKAGS